MRTTTFLRIATAALVIMHAALAYTCYLIKDYSWCIMNICNTGISIVLFIMVYRQRRRSYHNSEYRKSKLFNEFNEKSLTQEEINNLKKLLK